MEFAVEVFRDKNNEYIASCPKLEIYSYGHTLNMAVSRLEKIVYFYMESAIEMGVSIEEICLGNKSSGSPKRQQDSVLVRRRVN